MLNPKWRESSKHKVFCFVGVPDDLEDVPDGYENNYHSGALKQRIEKEYDLNGNLLIQKIMVFYSNQAAYVDKGTIEYAMIH